MSKPAFASHKLPAALAFVFFSSHHTNAVLTIMHVVVTEL